MAKYCNEHVCVSVCLSASLSPEHARSLPIFVHVAYRRGSVLLLWRGGEIPRGRGNFGVFPIDNALYSIAFGTHTKTAELIKMPFGLMTRVGLELLASRHSDLGFIVLTSASNQNLTSCFISLLI